jgi:inosose dehydratase
MAIPVAGSQITWGQFRKTESWTEDRILAQIAEAGYEGAPAGPRADRTPEQTVALYARHGLKPAPGYLGADFWNPQQREKILQSVKTQAACARDLGLSEWFVAPGGFDIPSPSGKTRKQVAGHVSSADALSDEQYQYFADTLNEAGALMLAHGVRACFHNHAGTFIETREEIDRLFSLVDPNVVFFGPDLGHLAWAGADVLDFVNTYAPRIKALHLKDINPTALEQGQRKSWDYDTYSQNGIFAELGEGFIDFAAVFERLKPHGYAGWTLAEIDVTVKPTALQSLTISRNYLKSIGI